VCGVRGVAVLTPPTKQPPKPQSQIPNPHKFI